MRVLFLILALFTAGCSGNKVTPSNDPRDKLGPQYTATTEQASGDRKGEKAMITVKGTVVYKTIEGGFWGFDAEDGKKYTPHGLKKEHRRDGVILEVTGYVEEDMVTFTQYGPILKVKSSTLLDESGAKEHYY